jgi:hypothetical protein
LFVSPHTGEHPPTSRLRQAGHQVPGRSHPRRRTPLIALLAIALSFTGSVTRNPGIPPAPTRHQADGKRDERAY